jgi:hypothetical protein
MVREQRSALAGSVVSFCEFRSSISPSSRAFLVWSDPAPYTACCLDLAIADSHSRPTGICSWNWCNLSVLEGAGVLAF